MTVRPVDDDQWEVVAWLWQAYRHDLSEVVHGFPYADGRYQHAGLDGYPRPDAVGYLDWRPHPNTGEDAPVAFAVVGGLDAARRTVDAFFVVPAARRGGTGRALAADVIARHPGAWEIAFQDGNVSAGHFWRAVARDAWGDAWTETEEPVPGKPDLPPDHWIRTI
ncbi:GNAT family N-acetyltransferase [Nocardioides sp. CN2-186]|uniref:GNAT family N-acetyltransferase n=1 Tax=Nocardioides tweenelious TaxID=3156607 RepID=UPI0032B3AE4E